MNKRSYVVRAVAGIVVGLSLFPLTGLAQSNTDSASNTSLQSTLQQLVATLTKEVQALLAQATQTSSQVNVAAVAVSKTPIGWFDGLETGTTTPILQGWAYDPKSPSTTILVHIYVDGPATAANNYANIADGVSTTILRPDVNAAYGITGNHGFTWAIPAKYRGASHTFYIYAINTDSTGVNPQIGGSPKTISVPGATVTTPAPTALIAQSLSSTSNNGNGTIQPFTLTWDSTNATSCTLQRINPAGNVALMSTSTYGSRAVKLAMIGMHHLWIDCSGGGKVMHQDLYHVVVPQSVAPASCNFNGQTIPSGSSVTAYQATSVPSGSQCVSQSRSCTNGTLSGTYAYASCSVQSVNTNQIDAFTVTPTVSCLSSPTTSNVITVTAPYQLPLQSWLNMSDSQNSVNGWYSGVVSGKTVMQAPIGLGASNSVSGMQSSLSIQPGKTYYVSIYEGSLGRNSVTKQFLIPKCNTPTPQPPTLTVLASGPDTTVTIHPGPWANANPAPWAEGPPWVMPGGWTDYLIDTDHSFNCSSPDKLTSGSVTLTQYCALVGTPQQSVPWLRNYNGAASAYVMNRDTQNAVLYAIVHGENKNEQYWNGPLLQNTVDTDFTVDPNFNAQKCSSGYTNGVYQDCWDGYNAFLSLETAPYLASNGYASTTWANLGPVVWPTLGYLNPDHSKSSGGVRQPTFFPTPDNQYLYVYYEDNSYSADDWGIKVARARISDLPLLGNKAFYAYKDGSFNTPALPAGFSNDSVSSFYTAHVPQAPAIFKGTYGRFAVASVIGTNYYIGVLENDNPTGTEITTSSDLVTWSAPITIINGPSSWFDGHFHYPLFLDASGSTNTAIDPSNFYIEGADNSGKIHLYHLSVKIQ